MDERRYLGIDYGGRRIGVAVSDLTGTIARTVDTLVVTSDDEAIGRLKSLVEEYRPAAIVIGLPLNLSGDESELSDRVRQFAERVKKRFQVEVRFEDERLSSRLAENILHSQGKKIKGNKGKVDRISAAVILQSFLDRRQAGKEFTDGE